MWIVRHCHQDMGQIGLYYFKYSLIRNTTVIKRRVHIDKLDCVIIKYICYIRTDTFQPHFKRNKESIDTAINLSTILCVI
jgi:hypothetical protein